MRIAPPKRIYSRPCMKGLTVYRKLVDVHYEELVDGNFRDYTADIFRAINNDSTDSSDSKMDLKDSSCDKILHALILAKLPPLAKNARFNAR